MEGVRQWGLGAPGESGALSPSSADLEEEWEVVVRTRVGQPMPKDRGMVRHILGEGSDFHASISQPD